MEKGEGIRHIWFMRFCLNRKVKKDSLSTDEVGYVI